MRRLFFRLDEWIQLQSVVTANEWITKVDEIQVSKFSEKFKLYISFFFQQALGNPLPKEITWMACAGSKPNLRGYTCGLWTLAHTITVEAYKQEKHSMLYRFGNFWRAWKTGLI